jgi:LytS/YehU family sensor histidine kinase
MYGDVPSADRMMSRLSDLLRVTLEAPPDQEVSLEDELELLRLYLEIMEARFGDRLRVLVEAGDEARAALVPTMVLQPLVENAIQHGVARRSGIGRVWVAARRSGQRLALEVRDDGPGISGDPKEAMGKGIGLSATADRLRQLYGETSSIQLLEREPHGLIVRLGLPYRRAPQVPSASEDEVAPGAARGRSAPGIATGEAL